MERSYEIIAWKQATQCFHCTTPCSVQALDEPKAAQQKQVSTLMAEQICDNVTDGFQEGSEVIIIVTYVLRNQ